jgi:hypothetical protein
MIFFICECFTISCLGSKPINTLIKKQEYSLYLIETTTMVSVNPHY